MIGGAHTHTGAPPLCVPATLFVSLLCTFIHSHKPLHKPDTTHYEKRRICFLENPNLWTPCFVCLLSVVAHSYCCGGLQYKHSRQLIWLLNHVDLLNSVDLQGHVRCANTQIVDQILVIINILIVHCCACTINHVHHSAHAAIKPGGEAVGTGVLAKWMAVI